MVQKLIIYIFLKTSEKSISEKYGFIRLLMDLSTCIYYIQKKYAYHGTKCTLWPKMSPQMKCTDFSKGNIGMKKMTGNFFFHFFYPIKVWYHFHVFVVKIRCILANIYTRTPFF